MNTLMLLCVVGVVSLASGVESYESSGSSESGGLNGSGESVAVATATDDRGNKAVAVGEDAAVAQAGNNKAVASSGNGSSKASATANSGKGGNGDSGSGFDSGSASGYDIGNDYFPKGCECTYS